MNPKRAKQNAKEHKRMLKSALCTCENCWAPLGSKHKDRIAVEFAKDDKKRIKEEWE